jgi:hypothetical protein
MPKSKIKGPQAFEGYKGILAKRLPFDPHWTAIRTFTGLRALAALNRAAADAPRAAANDSDLPNLFAPKFSPLDLDDRIAALYKAHGVDYGDDDELLFALATTHVPGLMTERAARGPAKRWTPKERARLRVAIDDYVADRKRGGHKITIDSACKDLAPTWSAKLGALRKQYDLAKQDWVEFVRDEQRYERWAKEHPEEAAKQRKSRLTELWNALTNNFSGETKE